MRLKLSHVVLLVILSSLLGAFAMSFFKQGKSVRNNSSIQEKNREPILGQAEFIKKENKSFSKLQKYIEKQWALKDILALDSWKEVLADKKNKKPIVVAVIDTGIYKKHPCFKNQLWINTDEIPNNGIDDDKNGFIDDVHGWNFVDNNNKILDSHGHGTHVSGIISAQGPPNRSIAGKARQASRIISAQGRSKCEIIGVAPHVKIMTLKYYKEGADSSDNIKNTEKSIMYAVQNGADIINYSGGGPGANQAERSAIAQAADKGIIFVAALGNEGSKIGKKTKYYPASYKLNNIVFVQSHNEREERVKSSNYIEKPILESLKVQTAPGENIISTLPPPFSLQGKLKNSSDILRSLASPFKKSYYGHMTGTSQATAVATGVVALVKAQHPTWNMEQIIQQVTQGRKLSAYGAVIMRPGNVDLSDQIDRTNTAVPHDPDKIEDIFKNPKKRHEEAASPQQDTFKQIKNINNIVNKK